MKIQNLLLLAVIIACVPFVSASVLPRTVDYSPPPEIIILVPNAPDDLEIVLLSEENITLYHYLDLWESHYFLNYREIRNKDSLTFLITSKSHNFESTIYAPFRYYANIYSLNLNKQELIPGTYPYRTILFVSLRVYTTLLLESLIFLSFGFRKNRSWLVFLISTFVSQIVINLMMEKVILYNGIGAFIYFVTGNLIAFIAELILFLLLIKENSKGNIFLSFSIASLVNFLGIFYLYFYGP